MLYLNRRKFLKVKQRMADRIVNVDRVEDLVAVFGSFDENVRRIEDALGVTIVNRGNELKVTGDEEAADKAVRTLEGLLSLAAKGEVIDEQRVRYLITLVREGNDDQIAQMAKDVVCITAKGKPIKAKTVGQQKYMKAIAKNTITIGVGPAGTGKTYLAVAAAVAAFRERTVNRIILTRPAVEAGERLGFLPGDLQNKVDPYLRPLYDALYDMLGPETFQKYQERGSIEVAPLAYMRGRTLDDSFIILDEAQNTTREQMKMFLTRLGFGSKIVITGDVTQIDLPDDKVSGLKDAVKVLEKYGWEIPQLSNADYNRHLKALGQMAGIKTRLHSHLARHTFATYMLRNGVKIENVSKMLGHTNITQTQRYAKVLAQSVHDDFDMVASKLEKNKRMSNP